MSSLNTTCRVCGRERRVDQSCPKCGAPTTLKRAIFSMLPKEARWVASEINNKVIDFQSQLFTTAMLEHPECQEVLAILWEKMKHGEDEKL